MEYRFDPIEGVYRGMAAAQSQAADRDACVFTIQAPLISTWIRASEVARRALAALRDSAPSNVPDAPARDSEERIIEACGVSA